MNLELANLYQASLFAGGIIALVSSVTVYYDGPRKQENMGWFLSNFFAAIWSFGYLLMISATDHNRAYLSNVILHWAATFIPLFYFFFALAITGTYEKYKKLFYMFSAGAVFFLFLNPTELFVRDVAPKFVFNYAPEPGPLYFLFAAYFFLIVVLSLLIIYKNILYTDYNEADRRRMKFILIASVLGFSGGGSVFLLTFNILPPYILPLFSFYPAVVTYAIVRHKLFDVKVIATEVITFSIWIFLLIQSLLAESLRQRTISLVLLVLMVSFGVFLIRSVKREVDQREQLQKITSRLRKSNEDLLLRNRYLGALQSITSEVTRSLSFDKFSQQIVDGVATKLGFVGGILYIVDKKTEKLEVSAATNLYSFAKAWKYLSQPLRSYSINVENGNNLVALSIKTGRVQIGTELSAFVSPPITKGVALIVQNTLRVRTLVAAPVFMGDQPLGCLLVAVRLPREKVTDTEIQMIKALADEVGIVARNLTLYEQLETANSKLVDVNTELSRLDKAKTEFLSIASHQLRTPLTAIKGYMSMVLEGDFGKYPEKMTEPLKDVFESAERLIALVNDLLDVSRIASGRLELHIQPVDIVALTQNVIEEIRPKVDGKNVEVIMDHQPLGKIFVQADPDKLRQVVINLIDNSIKYTPEGSVKVSFTEISGSLRYSVVDTGIGVSAEELPTLFHRFARTREAQLVQTEGTGLGLYVAKTIIEAMKGKIWVESDGLGKGSRFNFEIPSAEPPPKTTN